MLTGNFCKSRYYHYSIKKPIFYADIDKIYLICETYKYQLFNFEGLSSHH